MRIEPLTPAHDRAGFRCGIPSFDKYLRAQAGRDAARCLAAVFVAEMPGDKVAGYYALSCATILLPDLVGGGQRAISRYPELTAARLTRLAVDKRHRGKGYAEALLHDMIDRLQASPRKPVALIAEIHNEAARHFLEHAGFQSFADQPDRAFRALH
ncbi:GNAT family N-acetyltransferase [Acidocella sp.]|uniref:GNAT family N-acetyltransferase n=1 Tax=Acidocella sp. TaxID=50710 RepID=UPI00262C3704|nr:GNAT family N-acetyltransferase [Acidocella sp.]